jgi:hypothetical protein
VLNDVAVEQVPPHTGDRRAVSRTAANHERSRLMARAMQSGFDLAGVMCFALVLGGMVQSAVSRPMAMLSTATAGAPNASN